jgi:hypothetical protein
MFTDRVKARETKSVSDEEREVEALKRREERARKKLIKKTSKGKKFRKMGVKYYNLVNKGGKFPATITY